MRERTNLHVLAEADSKSVAKAREILESTKQKWSKYKTVELPMKDSHNTVIIITKKKLSKVSIDYYFKKYQKVLGKKAIYNEVISRNILNTIS